jgi:4-amino-4-deoxy-L-arabinose transferase-like glycosyltransferase
MESTFRNFSISISDRIAILFSLLAVLASVIVAERVYENIPHLEDEMAYVWQAQAIARGQLTVPSPPEPKSFLVPFVVDYQGQRFGKYPLGWPVLLSFGVSTGLRFLVNPLLAGLGIWLTYRLGKQVFGETAGLLAAGLTLTSPFFLMVSGSLLSHPFGLVLSTVFALAWLDGFANPTRIVRWMPILTAAASLGLLILTRPFTAIAIALPFCIHGFFLFIRGDRRIRIRLAGFGIIVLGLAAIHFLWQYAVTGDPLLNPYTLWWSYDKVGFGRAWKN